MNTKNRLFSLAVSSILLIPLVVGCEEKESNDNRVIDKSNATALSLLDEDISGIWVDQSGFAMEIDIDNGYLIDASGHCYSIENVFDDCIELDTNATPNTMYDYEVINCDSLPIPTTYKLDLVLYDDGSIVYGEEFNQYECVRIDSELGHEYSDSVKDSIIGKSIQFLQSREEITFSEDYSIMHSISYDIWEFENCCIKLIDTDGVEKDRLMAVRFKNPECWTMITIPNDLSNSRSGTSSSMAIDAHRDFSSCWEGEYLYWNCEEKATDTWLIDSNWNIRAVHSDGSSSDAAIDLNRYQDNGIIGKWGLWLNNKDNALYTSLKDNPFVTSGVLLDRNSVLAQMLYYRTEMIANNSVSNSFSYTYEDNHTGIVTNLVADSESSVWIYDDVSFSAYTRDSAFYPRLEGIQYLDWGDAISINFEDEFDCDVCLEYTIPSILIYNSDFLKIVKADSTSEEIPFEIESEISIDDTFIHISANIPESGVYLAICYDPSLDEAYNTLYTIPVLRSISPDTSLWAMTCDTGNIIPLVNIEAIRSADVHGTGDMNFWISTPEDLAAATYFINAFDACYAAQLNMFYIHLLNDIDLTGYEWVPIGCYGNQGEVGPAPLIYDGDTTAVPFGTNRTIDGRPPFVQHYFQGIFFGNGYTIRGLDIDSSRGTSFFERAHTSTVIGLTLEDPNVEYDGVFVDDASAMMEFYDCHIAYTQAPDQIPAFGHSANNSITYHDCSYIIEGTDIPLDPSIYSNEHYRTRDNWVRMVYQNADGSYTYDSQTEYEAWSDNKRPFENMSYYFGSECPVYGSNPYAKGWTVNTIHFATDFGYWDFE